MQYASYELREDREVVLAAVAQNGTALEFASTGLKGDAEFVMAAVAQSGCVPLPVSLSPSLSPSTRYVCNTCVELCHLLL